MCNTNNISRIEILTNIQFELCVKFKNLSSKKNKVIFVDNTKNKTKITK